MKAEGRRKKLRVAGSGFAIPLLFGEKILKTGFN
jgi:hypothetical protein